MSFDLALLQSELLAGHPITGAYSADAATAVSELNEYNITSAVSISKIAEYMLLETHKSNEGTDLQVSSLYGRLEQVALSSVGDDPLGSGTVTDQVSLCAAKSFVWMLSNQSLNLDLSDAKFETLAGKLSTAKVYGIADKGAIIALSNNIQSRAIQIGLGRVSIQMIDEARGEEEILALLTDNSQHVAELQITTSPSESINVIIEQRYGADLAGVTGWVKCGAFTGVKFPQRKYEATIPEAPAAYRELRCVSPVVIGMSQA